jgi:dienelactone hydrolase
MSATGVRSEEDRGRWGPLVERAIPTRPRSSRAVRVALALTTVFLALALLLPPGRVAVKVLAVLPEIFPDAPARPLTWVTPAPAREELSYDFPGGHMDSDLYLPAGDGPHGAVILYGGVFALRRDPSMVRFAEALSRAGAVVLVPESNGLLEGAITPEEVDGLLDAVAYLGTRAEVDPRRLGVCGFSAGGSLVLLAAEHESGREQIAFVNVIGAYYDALDLVRAVASRSYLLDGQTVAWEPAAVTTFEFAKLLIAALPDANDQDILSRAYLDKPPQPLDGLEALSPAGRLALELLENPAPKRIDAIIAGLPASTRAQLTAISPSAGIASLRTRLYLMHDLSDSYVPFTHSRALAAAAPPGTLRHYSEFDLFGHVMPNRQLPPAAFAGELAKLFYHAWLIGQEFL